MVVDASSGFYIQEDGRTCYCIEADVEFLFDDGYTVVADIDYSSELLSAWGDYPESSHSLDITIKGKYDENGNECAFDARDKDYYYIRIKNFLEDEFKID